MANQIQRLPVIEWQPEPVVTSRPTVSYNTPQEDSTGFYLFMAAVAAICIGGLTIAGMTSVNTDPYPQTSIHRSL